MKNKIIIFLVLASFNGFGQITRTLSNVTNTADSMKPVSTVQKAAIVQKLQTVSTISALQAFTDATIATFDGSQWNKKSGNVASNGGAFAGTIINVNASFYWERKTDYITPEMFGAVGDGTNDDTQSFQNCINSQQTSQKKIVTKGVTYKITTTLTKAQSFIGLNIQGQEGTTVFNFSTIATGLPCIKIIGGSGQLCKSEISGIKFIGNSTSIAVEIAGQCGQNVKKCIFDTNSFGVRFHNEATGSFTEYDLIDNCTFLPTCLTPVIYKRTTGNDSFHGSGMSNRTTITSNTTNPIVIISDGCNVYNAMMDFQLWTSTAVTVFQNLNTGYLKPTLIGNITIEIFGTNIVTLATGIFPTYFTGNFSSLNDYIEYGSLIKSDFSQSVSNGTVVTKGAKWSGLFNLVTGDNLLNPPLYGTTLDAYLHISASNYDYRYKLIIENNGLGFSPTIKKITNSFSLNGAGYGDPVISSDANGRIVVTNALFPATGVKCYLTLSQASDEYFGGGQHFSSTSTNVITTGIGTKYPMSDVYKDANNLLTTDNATFTGTVFKNKGRVSNGGITPLIIGSQRFDGSGTSGIAGLYHIESGAGGFGQAGALGLYTSLDDAAPTLKVFIGTDGKVGFGTPIPTSKLQVVGLSTYADNATALAAGLTAGAFYRTATGVLMVAF